MNLRKKERIKWETLEVEKNLYKAINIHSNKQIKKERNRNEKARNI